MGWWDRCPSGILDSIRIVSGKDPQRLKFHSLLVLGRKDDPPVRQPSTVVHLDQMSLSGFPTSVYGL